MARSTDRAQVVNTTPSDLARILRTYGEERFVTGSPVASSRSGS